MESSYLMLLYFKHKSNLKKTTIKKIIKKKGILHFLTFFFRNTKHVSISENLSYFIYDNRSSRSDTETTLDITYSDIYNEKKE
jgi:hypothetical protein